MFGILIVIHVLICLGLVIVVLMQSSKGEGLAGAFGGGGGISNAVFGGRGAASFLSKATTFLAVMFMVSCMGLSLMSAGKRPSTEIGTESAVSTAAQEDLARQQQQAAQQQASPIQAAPGVGEGTEGSASPEDIFNANPAVPDSQ